MKSFNKETKIEHLESENKRLLKHCEVLIHLNQRLKRELHEFLKGATEALAMADPKPIEPTSEKESPT